MFQSHLTASRPEASSLSDEAEASTENTCVILPESGATLKDAVGGNYTKMEGLMGMLQPSACGNLTIYRGNSSVYSTRKPCSESGNVVSAARALVSDGEAYPVIIRLWYGRQI